MDALVKQMTGDVQNLRKLDLGPDQTLVFLIRHAQTGWNKEQRFQGHLDIPLSSTGIEQAAALRDWLSRLDIPFAAVYTSDLARAAQTANAVCKSTGLSPILAPALREIHCGEWQGLLASELEAQYPEQINHWRTIVDSCAMKGGESLLDVQTRVSRFYRESVEAHGGQAIILVTHGAALSALVAAIMDTDLGEFWRERRLRHDNTGVTVVLQDRKSVVGRILHSNLIQHLGSLKPLPDGPPHDQ